MEDTLNVPIYWNHRVILLSLSVILLGVVLECVRRELLKERYAMLWLATAIVGFVVGMFPELIVSIARVMQFQYITVLYSLSFLFLLGIVLSFTVVISRLSERNKQLAQEVALLANHIERLQRSDDA